jgi:hypothetical protein
MTPVRAALYDYVEFDEPPVIYVGNGVPCKVLGKGSLYVRPRQHPRGDRDIKISEVWYVPDLIETLISLKQLTDKGAKGEFEEDVIIVYDKTSMFHLFTARYQTGIGYVPEWDIIGPKQEALAFFARQTKEDALLWHARLGHCNMPAIAEMVKNNHATGINVPHEQFAQYKDDACPVCIAAKLQRKPYETQPMDPNLKPGEVLCSDVAGPYQVQTLGGAWYLFMIVDYVTSKFFPVVMKDRKHVAEIVPDLMHKIEEATGNKCKIFQTDGGGEYVSNVMKDFLSLKGI